MDRRVVCEVCGEELHWKDFQKHLIEQHRMLFVQYIGLVAKTFNMLTWLKGK